MRLHITDGANHPLAAENFTLKWGQSASVAAKDSKLPYDLNVDFWKPAKIPTKLGRRVDKPPNPVMMDWEDWVISLTAGKTKWNDMDKDSSKLPYCTVGGWDNGDFWNWLHTVLAGKAGDIPVSQVFFITHVT